MRTTTSDTTSTGHGSGRSGPGAARTLLAHAARGLRVLLPLVVIAALGLGFAPLPGSTPTADGPALPSLTGDLTAGAASIDMTWHVGASQGQYAGEGPGPYDQPSGGTDPGVHATTSRPTRGVESRDTARALVVDDGEDRWALLTNDLYIPQDVLSRRVAGLLAEHDLLNPERATGITADNLTVSVSHSHSSPFYSSTTWGPWAFQDVFDIRFFEFVARRMADAVIAASDDMRPARAAVATTPVTIAKRNPEGPTVSAEDEPLPAAWPLTEVDATLSLLRVDDVTETGDPQPLANWVVWGRHPEGMKDNGLHTGEYVGALLRTLDREEGGVALFSQNDVGTSEIARDARAHVPAARQEYDDNAHDMLERVARDLADEVIAASRDIDRRWTDPSAPLVDAEQVALIGADADLGVTTERVAPPGYRLFPTVSNCRTAEAANGNPQAPVVGLPDCTGPGRDLAQQSPVDPGVTYDTLREAGVPVPDNYGAPSYAALQETTVAPLQAIRLGGVAFTVCPCEQFTDQSRNIRSRLDATDGNLWFGWDWTANHRFNEAWEPGVAYVGDLLDDAAIGDTVTRGPAQLDLDPDTPGDQFWCEPDDAAAPTQWTCKDPRVIGGRDDERLYPSWDEWPTLAPVSHEAFVRWKARIYNDATGWDEYVAEDGSPSALEAEAEPLDPAQIWGNWTHEELTDFSYDIVVPVSMANSYWGYIPSYREFQVRDYYRKALAGLGPHGSDFLATRLTRMAAELNGAPADLFEPTPKDLAYAAEEDTQQTAKAALVGSLAEGYLPAYEAGLPADAGDPGATVADPDPVVQRPDVATFSWVGGSNYTDVPHARVERLVDGEWTEFGNGYGEVQVTVDLPDPAELPASQAGQYEWVWTATFEAHVADIERTFADGTRTDAVPPGTYRFVVDGCHRGLAPAGPGATGEGCSQWDATGRVSAYRAESVPFEVTVWDGIVPVDGSYDDATGIATARIAPEPTADPSTLGTQLTHYLSGVGRIGHAPQAHTTGVFDHATRDAVVLPHTPDDHPGLYIEGFRAGEDVRDYGNGEVEHFCFRCAFEPWAVTAEVSEVTWTVTAADGTSRRVAGTYDPATGRWQAQLDLGSDETATIAPGGVRTAQGDTNAVGLVDGAGWPDADPGPATYVPDAAE